MRLIIIVVLFFLPLVFFIIPINGLIPELRKFVFIATPFAIGFLFIANSILIAICYSGVKRKIILISTTAIFSFMYLYFFMDYKFKIDFSSLKISEKRTIQTGDIYRLNKKGMFNSFEGSEIGFSNKYSFLYKTYYSSKNHLVIKEANDSSITISEYAVSHEWDTSSTQLIPKRGNMIKTNIRDTVVCITDS